MRLFAAVLLLSSTACTEYELGPGIAHDEPAVCPTDAPEDYAAAPTSSCEREPEIGPFDPVVEWQWDTNPTHSPYVRVETPPVIFDLTDDGVPDMVFTAFKDRDYNGKGAMIAVDGATGDMLWSKRTFFDHEVWGISGVAAARLSGEVALFVGVQGGLVRVDAQGNGVWFVAAASAAGGFAAPAIGDIEGDGVADIALGAQVFDENGHERWSAGDDDGKRYAGSFLVDLEGDGIQELVAGPAIFNGLTGVRRWYRADLDRGWPALGDLDGDGTPELVVSHKPSMSVVGLDGVTRWQVGFPEEGGGPPTVADFDGDGLAEIGVACKEYYRVYEGNGSLLWQHATRETSSGITGSSVFDFEGDGAAEVVYADEGTLWVFDGASGAVELELDHHNSGTRYEYPTIADVDADGAAEIIAPHGRDMHGTDTAGISIIGSAAGLWAPARQIWNQHAYYITNIEDDGTLPLAPAPNWVSWNNFRAANSTTKVGLSLPDLRPSTVDSCLTACDQGILEFFVPVENGGLIDAEFVEVVLERIDGSTRTIVDTQQVPLVPAEGATWAGPFAVEAQDFGSDGLEVRVVPTVPFGTDGVYECDSGNNALVLPVFPC